MDDIRAVMDAAGSERAALVGISEGGPLVLLFGATYPERATALVAWGTFARILRAPDYPMGVEPGVTKFFIDTVVADWGSGDSLRFFIGASREPDPETTAYFARLERGAATPKMVGEILRRNVEIDIRNALSAITAPTLVVHRRGDYLVPFECGQYIADHIEDARLVELPGDFHLDSGDVDLEDAALDAIEEFLTGRRHEAPIDIDRVLKTVLFTDIVGFNRTRGGHRRPPVARASRRSRRRDPRSARAVPRGRGQDDRRRVPGRIRRARPGDQLRPGHRRPLP